MISVSGKHIVHLHSVFASSAFICALMVGYYLHFDKIVRNAHYGYPDEWFPSVSATIGDRYPERSLFQILIAVSAFPRFLLLFMHWFRSRSLWGVMAGLLRTMTCGGWVYITSTDDHDAHDVFMIAYIVLTIPWSVFVVRSATRNKTLRAAVATTFFGTLVPLIYWFIQHNVKRRAGAYSIYAYFEWSLIVLDVLFDGLSYADMEDITITLGTQGSTPSVRILKAEAGKLVPKVGSKELAGGAMEEVLEEVIIMQEHEKLVYLPDQPITSQASLLYVLVSSFDSFMFWTNLTALLCMIWFFPLWYMGISGYEAVIASVLSPVLLYVPFVPTLVQQYGPLLANAIGIGAYIIEKPEWRLMTVAVATGISTMNLAVTLKNIAKDKARVAQFAITWAIGLVASVVLKMAFYSNNPLWPIMKEENGGWNKTGLAIATVFAMITPYVNRCHYASSNSSELSSQTYTNLPLYKSALASIGFGALIFSIHQSLTESSTLVYWCWEGWSQSAKMGPLSWPFSGLTCVAMVLGVHLSRRFANSPGSTSRWLLALSTAVLATPHITGWYKFVFGGLPYALSIMLFIPNYFITMNRASYVSLSASFAVYIILTLAHVWTVAYAFVPYGWVLRERLHWVLTASTLCILLGSCDYQFSIPISATFLKRVIVALAGVMVAIAYSVEQLKPTGVPQPYHPDANLITAGIWTIHFGLDNDLWASENRMIDLIRDMELDLVGLLETDTQRITTGNRDLTARMSHELQMYADYGPGPNKHTWGAVLLSKFPIVESTHHLLPSPVGELAPVIHAVIDAYGELVDVYVFHSGQEEDVLDRKLQSETLRDIMGARDRPAILLSYLVTKPNEGNYHTYVSDASGMQDIDHEDDDRWCQYILYKNLKRTGFARVSRSTITDTELQVGKFQVHNGVSHGLNRVEKSQVSDSLRFPDKFLGDGVRGHRYHVFNEPRYYE
ncbi:AaceriAEL043Wp [[Ashbya] aceris (nom. inval.)]|nr:AaceriAEL043Wp [[Ashbya] aceris (nom. inval.)]